MAGQESEILADRLNHEPPIFRGLSNSELGVMIKVAGIVWVPICFFIAFLFGKAMMGLGAAMMMMLITVVLGGTAFQRIKRGRPDYYYQHWIMMRKKKNTHSQDVLKYTGDWDLGRVDEV